MSIEKLIRVKKKIALPIIVHCAEAFNNEGDTKSYHEYYVPSLFYQTSRMACFPFYKSLSLKKSNEK
jgi:hypothetical protein